MLLGALEAGGTKMVMAVGNEYGEILMQSSIPTETPDLTMNRIINYFSDKKIAALGVGSFGPVDLDRNSKSYGFITSTPKKSWVNYNLLETLKALQIPIGFDTDVNASVLGEATWGCLKDLSSGVYITIGTGIGAGVMINGNLLHGMLHPEVGHMLLTRHEKDDYSGICPYHPNCFEGLASGPSIEMRWGRKAIDLQDHPEVWELEAFYIAQGLVNIILTYSPHRIILGGGVMHQKQLFPMIRSQVLRLLNGYIKTPQLTNPDEYIVPASLKDNQGILGCLELAKRELLLDR
jgi:fructokinase